MVIPIRENVLVKPLESDSVSEGGIIVPDSVKRRKNKGVVIAVGNGTKQFPMTFAKDEVVYNIKDCGQRIDINNEPHFLIKSYDLLAKD